MYAVTHTVTITDRSTAESGLEKLVPQISTLPSFVAGYWMERSANEGVAVVTFDSQDAARSFANFLKGAPEAPGVATDRESIEVCEVLAHA